MFLLFNSQHVSAEIGHHQAILEGYTNFDGVHMNYNASIQFVLVKIGLDPTLILYILDFKLRSHISIIMLKIKLKQYKEEVPIKCDSLRFLKLA
jgi:hypothetical protein